MLPPSRPESVARGLPVAASQTRAVLSSDAVTMRVPSGLNCALLTPRSCPESVARGLPVAASQTRAVLSYDAVTMRVPSGLNCALVTTSSLMPRERGEGLASRGVPDPRGLVH